MDKHRREDAAAEAAARQTAALKEELKLARERFSVIFENTTVSIWDYIFATRQIVQPVRSQQLHGFESVVENVPDSLIDSGFVHPDSAPAFRALYQRLLAGEKHVEGVFRVQTADRSGYWYEHIRYNTLFDEGGRPYAAVGMSTDVTQEVESRQSVERWRELLNAALGARDAVIEFDLSHDALVSVENASRAPEGDWSRFSFDEYIDAYAKNYVYISDMGLVRERLRRARLLTEYLDGAREFCMEYRMQHNGELRWVLLNARFSRMKADGDVHFFMLHTDITQQKEKELALQRQAASDTLTELLNRRAFNEQAQTIFEQFPRQPHALLLMDLDEFKKINDGYGHQMGDRVLHIVGQRVAALLAQSGESAIACRASGDEFAILFYDGSPERVGRFAQKLLQAVSRPALDGVRLSASVGLALSPQDGRDLEALYLSADRALYHVKRHGKGAVRFYDSLRPEDREVLMRRQQFLSSTIAGGMLGSYREPGFPFYFIDERMLHYLGYGSEAEFVEDIEGRLENCIHPDDRAQVVESMEQQLRYGNTYEVEYRLRKKSGGYIWVHDTGEQMTAPDGRAAVTAVCYDITVQKEHDALIQRLVNDARGGIALYRLEENEALTLLYASEGLGQLAGRSNEEYRALCGADAMQTIYETDRAAVRQIIRQAVAEDTACSAGYRVPDRNGRHVWITGTFSKYGEENGRPILRAVFIPLPLQYELQLQTLDLASIGVYVIDQHTHELYYANDASFRLHNAPVCDIAGKTCHEVFHGSCTVCEDCLFERTGWDPSQLLQYPVGDRFLSTETQTRRWNDRDIRIVYTQDVTEQVRAQDGLRQSHEMMETACSLADLWIFSYDMDRQTIFPGRKLQQDLGFPAQIENFPQAERALGLVLPEYRALYCQRFAQLRDGAAEVSFDVQSLLADGKPHWLRFKGRRLDPLPAGPRLAVVSAQNIDIEKSMEARLELERQKQQCNDKNLLYYYVTNVTRNTVLEYRGVSPRVLSHPESMRDMDCFTADGLSFLIYDSDKARAAQLYARERLLDSYQRGSMREEYTSQMRLADGSICHTRHVLRLLKNPVTSDILLYEYVYDTSHDQIISALLQLEFTGGYEAVGFLVVQEDQFTALYFAPPRRELTTLAENMRQYAQTLVHPDARARFLAHYLERDYAHGPLTSAEIVYRVLVDGEVLFYKGMLYLYAEDGKRFCVFTRRNYTEIVRAEEEEKQRLADALERAEKAGRAKNEFLARMSHDMRTPMNAIIGLTSLTIDAAEDPNEVRANMSKLYTASDFLLNLVNDILDMSRIEGHSLALNPGSYLYSDFLMNLQTIFVPQCQAKGIRLHFETPVTNARIRCDKTRLNQIFYNLFSNAVKYTPPGGAIEYRVENLRCGEGRLEADYVVADSGIGMSEEFQQHMFEPFARENNAYTAELQGSGLGLSITKQLVELMGGQLRIDSRKGQGTTVTVHLAFECLGEDAPASPTAPDAEAADVSLQGRTVLLAEDHPINAEIAIKLLERQGMTVLHAENGQAAVEKFRASTPGSIDAILMDIRMPVMDGLEAAAAIRALARPDARTVPILAMSANAYAEDVEKSLSAGMNAHLSKPVDQPLLLRTLRKYLGGAR